MYNECKSAPKLGPYNPEYEQMFSCNLKINTDNSL